MQGSTATWMTIDGVTVLYEVLSSCGSHDFEQLLPDKVSFLKKKLVPVFEEIIESE